MYMITSMSDKYSYSYYDILALPAPTINGSASSPSSPLITSQAVKKAYRNALLKWHPDKAIVNAGVSTPISTTTTRSTPTRHNNNSKDTPGSYQFTLDEIITAYTALSTERGRREYERKYRLELAEVLLRDGVGSGSKGSSSWNTYVPMEIVDLDDFQSDERMGKFFKGCRCGEEEGYVLWERDLEEIESGEVEVGCVGCSLWLRVQFEIVAEWEGEDGTRLWSGEKEESRGRAG